MPSFTLHRFVQSCVVAKVPTRLVVLRLFGMASDRPASWCLPTEKQLEKMAKQAALQPASPAPQDDGWWQSVLTDPALDRSTWVPIKQRRLSEIPRPMLRDGCIRYGRAVEISHVDALRLHGAHATWKEVGMMDVSIARGGTKTIAVGRVRKIGESQNSADGE